MIDILKFASPSYLFMNFPRPLSSGFLRAWIAIGIIMIVGGIMLRIWSHYRKDFLPAWVKWWQRVGAAAVTFGVFAFILLFFRQEQTPWFSARYWIVLWVLLLLAWSAYLGFLAWRDVPAKATLEADDRRRRKYLP
ncbi:MAG: hypothetical protein WC817_01570 [Patescibacteria group bacterium]|jgi:hypothetical protein